MKEREKNVRRATGFRAFQTGPKKRYFFYIRLASSLMGNCIGRLFSFLFIFRKAAAQQQKNLHPDFFEASRRSRPPSSLAARFRCCLLSFSTTFCCFSSFKSRSRMGKKKKGEKERQLKNWRGSEQLTPPPPATSFMLVHHR